MAYMYKWALVAGFFMTLPNVSQAKTFQIAVAANTIDTVVSEVIVKKAYQMLGHESLA